MFMVFLKQFDEKISKIECILTYATVETYIFKRSRKYYMQIIQK